MIDYLNSTDLSIIQLIIDLQFLFKKIGFNDCLSCGKFFWIDWSTNEDLFISIHTKSKDIYLFSVMIDTYRRNYLSQ